LAKGICCQQRLLPVLVTLPLALPVMLLVVLVNE
jgi:hypothetical protein